jgi:hypothetical protein
MKPLDAGEQSSKNQAVAGIQGRSRDFLHPGELNLNQSMLLPIRQIFVLLGRSAWVEANSRSGMQKRVARA